MSVAAACAIGALLLGSSELKLGPGRSELVLETGPPTSVRYDAPQLGDVASELAGAEPTNILTVCPALLTRLPSHVRSATEEDRRKAAIDIPVPNAPSLESVYVSSLNAPVIDPSGRNAVVLATYACSGLCGGGMAFRFRRTSVGWTRHGRAQSLWVS